MTGNFFFKDFHSSRMGYNCACQNVCISNSFFGVGGETFFLSNRSFFFFKYFCLEFFPPILTELKTKACNLGGGSEWVILITAGRQRYNLVVDATITDILVFETQRAIWLRERHAPGVPAEASATCKYVFCQREGGCCC